MTANTTSMAQCLQSIPGQLSGGETGTVGENTVDLSGFSFQLSITWTLSIHLSINFLFPLDPLSQGHGALLVPIPAHPEQASCQLIAACFRTVGG